MFSHDALRRQVRRAQAGGAPDDLPRLPDIGFGRDAELADLAEHEAATGGGSALPEPVMGGGLCACVSGPDRRRRGKKFCAAVLCPCAVHGATAESVGSGGCLCCACAYCWLAVLSGCTLPAWTRQRVVREAGYSERPVTSWCAHLWCGPCALAQEERCVEDVCRSEEEAERMRVAFSGAGHRAEPAEGGGPPAAVMGRE